jgi:serine/threonine protein kinase
MMKEARVAEHLDHPAVTHYFGLFVKDSDQTNELADFYLVSDYVNGGLAREYLSHHRTPANTEQLVSTLLSSRAVGKTQVDKQFSDLMKGLTYMHSEQQIGGFNKKMICHGDLKSVSLRLLRILRRHMPKIRGAAEQLPCGNRADGIQ